MSLECTNTGKIHWHERAEEVLVCYGLIPTTRIHPSFRFKATPVAAPEPGPEVEPTTPPRTPVHGPLAPATDAQVDYVEGLGGDPAAARRMTRGDCSDYINKLKSMPRATRVAAPSMSPDVPAITESKTDVDPEAGYHAKASFTHPDEIDHGFLSLFDKGYFAVREEESKPWTFFMVTKPKSGKFEGTIKVQRQIGSYMGGRTDLVYVAWPSGKVSTYKAGFRELVMIAIAGQTKAMRDYAEQSQRCCRCNAELTDARSLYYGIGPECEKSNRGLIEDINLEKGPFEAAS